MCKTFSQLLVVSIYKQRHKVKSVSKKNCLVCELYCFVFGEILYTCTSYQVLIITILTNKIMLHKIHKTYMSYVTNEMKTNEMIQISMNVHKLQLRESES